MLGLSALFRACRDAKILCLQRFIRLFAYSGTTLVLALHLAELGNSDTKIGLFMTLTLIGDIFISLFLAFIADRMGRRNILVLGSVAIIASGLIFGLIDNFWVLLVGATIGVISPTGNEIGPFRAIEESIIAHLTPLSERSDVYSWYSLIGILGAAMGTMACGWVTQFLESKKHWNKVEAYRVVFFGYAILGLVKLGLTVILSSACEAREEEKLGPRSTRDTSDRREDTPLLSENFEDQESRKESWLGVPVRKDSLVVLAEVCFLLALEAIAMGLIVTSWVAFYFHQKFGIQEGRLGVIFFVYNLLQASGNIAGSAISKRLGVPKTMALASFAAAAGTVLIPIPESAPLGILFLLLKSSTNVIGLRTALVSSMYLPEERTAFMGVSNAVRTFGASLGPVITGALASKRLFWVTFMLSGGMVAAYGIGILALFGSGRTREGKMKQSAIDADSEER